MTYTFEHQYVALQEATAGSVLHANGRPPANPTDRSAATGDAQPSKGDADPATEHAAHAGEGDGKPAKEKHRHRSKSKHKHRDRDKAEKGSKEHRKKRKHRSASRSQSRDPEAGVQDAVPAAAQVGLPTLEIVLCLCQTRHSVCFICFIAGLWKSHGIQPAHALTSELSSMQAILF